MAKLTKGMLRACGSMVKRRSKHSLKYCGHYRIGNHMYVNTPYQIIVFDCCEVENVDELEEYCNYTKKFQETCLQTFDKFDNCMYTEELSVMIDIADTQHCVSSAKKTISWRNHKEITVFKQETYGVKYDTRLLLEAMKCIDSKQVKAYFPKNRLYPIFLEGSMGRACVLPCFK